MAMITVPLTLSDELAAMIGSPEELADRAREALVLELVRNGTVSQGRAAELLGISRKEMMQLAFRHQIPMGPQSPEEVAEELAILAQARNDR